MAQVISVISIIFEDKTIENLKPLIYDPTIGRLNSCGLKTYTIPIEEYEDFTTITFVLSDGNSIVLNKGDNLRSFTIKEMFNGGNKIMITYTNGNHDIIRINPVNLYKDLTDLTSVALYKYLKYKQKYLQLVNISKGVNINHKLMY